MRRAQRWNIVWVVPIVAILVGGWLLYQNFFTHGPTATIRFETAEEIYAGKTEVRCRSVKVGIVRKILLSDSLDSVSVIVEMDDNSEQLLSEGSRFWVVKPRLSAAEISGLGTLIQGSYIELDPGPKGSKRVDQFEGLEKPPATNSSVPGLRIKLAAKEAGMLQIGAPIYHRGFEVGRIEDRQLAEDGEEVIYDAFIARDYYHLITNNTHFWNSSGIEIDAGTRGIMLRTPSIDAILSGGVSFGLVEGMKPGKECQDGEKFELFADKESARYSSLNPTLELLLLFDQSVRGLTTDSAVDFRGIPIGHISRISYDLVEQSKNAQIPVLIRIDPNRLHSLGLDSENTNIELFLQQQIDKGLRAGLKTTSLVTSAVHIDFDYFPAAEKAALGKRGEYTSFPTVPGGFDHMETQLNSIIAKIDALSIDSTLAEVEKAAKEGKAMAASARIFLEDTDIKGAITSIGPKGELQGDVKKTLEELRETMRSLKAVADLLEEKPNAIIFGAGNKDDKDDESSRPRLGGAHRN